MKERTELKKDRTKERRAQSCGQTGVHVVTALLAWISSGSPAGE